MFRKNGCQNKADIKYFELFSLYMSNDRNEKENNFNIIRFGASLFVFGGHTARVMGIAAPMFSGYSLHEMGVAVLFMLAGYLVTESWLKDPNVFRYSIKRFFRLWPPFAVMVLIMTFAAGPLVSDIDAAGYFHSWYLSYLNNLRFYIIYSLPGVFSDLPISNTVNGSIWTMPVEAAMYIVTPVIITLFYIHRRSKKSFLITLAFAIVLVFIDLYFIAFYKGPRIVFYNTDIISAHHVAVSYVTGILFTYPQMRRLLDVQKAIAGMGLLLLVSMSPAPILYFLLDLLVPYFIFSFALDQKPVFSGFGRRIDLSYGIFLYGFFFQQLTIKLIQGNAMNLGFLQVLIISVIPTVMTAVLSFYLVEKPSLLCCRYLLKKIEKNGKDER